MKPDEIPPGTHVEPNPDNPWPVADAAKADGSVEAFFKDRDNDHRVPRVDLLHGAVVDPPVGGAAAAVAVPVSKPKAEGPSSRRKGMAPWWIGVAIVILLLAGGTGYMILSKQKKPAVAVTTPSPTPQATPTPSPTPSATPSPSPSPTPSATPVPQTVTAPVTAPSTSHPQAVTITSKSGLWLRSSPTSASQSNVIGWMPDGAQVSVDATGNFWWHGTYKGRNGYFASKYTQ